MDSTHVDPIRAAATSEVTPRQAEMILLVGEGLRTREIATRLDLTESTVDTTIRDACRALGVRGRRAAVAALAERAHPTTCWCDDLPHSDHLDALLAHLERGCSVEEAADRAGMSARTAFRVLAAARARMGVRSTAPLLFHHAGRRAVAVDRSA